MSTYLLKSNGMPHATPRGGRLYAALAALSLVLLALGPHFYFFYKRGAAWQGTLPFTHSDEVMYAAYLKGRVEGHTRLSDPYTGRDASAGDPVRETTFSVQFLPPAVLATAARLFGASGEQAFFWLTPLAAAAAALAVFGLTRALTNDARASAAGAVFVLCLGSAHVAVQYALRGETFFSHLSFLRRFSPSFSFPVFFVFCWLVWRALGGGRRAVWAAASAGVCFAALVYSYFFLWTAALAWLAGLTLLWLVAFRAREGLKPLALVWALAAAALVPYFVLLSRRTPDIDEAQLLVRTHAPDFSRLPELVGLAAVLLLAWAARAGRVKMTDRAVVFTASLALTPLAVFNQQVLTGRSLQPNHYELFVAGHAALLAAWASSVLAWRGARGRRVPARALAAVAFVALAAGGYQALLSGRASWRTNLLRDEARPALERLSAPDFGAGARATVFATDPVVADSLPTVAPQPVVWAPHMLYVADMTTAEDRERMSLYLYLLGVRLDDIDPNRFERLDRFRKYFVSSLIGRARHNWAIRTDWTPISASEVAAALGGYSDFVSKLDRALVAKYPLTYVLTSPREGVDFTNLDLWYERDEGESVGEFVIYRVTLRQ